MSKNFTIKVTIDETADQDLYNLLEPVYARRRAEHLRQLAKAGITGSLVTPNSGVQGNAKRSETDTTNKPLSFLSKALRKHQ